MIGIGRIIVLTLFFGLSLRAAVPTLDYLFPAGGKVDSKFKVIIGGAAEPWPAKAWCDDPAVTFEALTNKFEFNVSIKTNATQGPHIVRVFNNEGSSACRIFVVNNYPEITEQNPNDNLKTAQAITNLPVVINGRFLEANDVDTYAIQLAAGKTFVSSFDGFKLGSMMDPVMHLFDSLGKRLAFNHDHGSLDPFIAYPITNSGKYFVQVMAFNYPYSVNVNFFHSANSVYRLTLTQGPYAENTWPLVTSSAKANKFEFLGYNLSAKPENNFRPHLSAVPEIFEMEPNNNFAQAQKISIPVGISGIISSNETADYFKFTVTNGQKLRFEILSGKLGFSLNSSLRIEDEKGAGLGAAESGEDRDVALNWTAPRAADFVVYVNDLRKFGGDNFRYHLSITPQEPKLTATSDAQSFVFEAGKTNDLPIKLQRENGFDHKLTMSISGAPEGLKILNPEIGEKETAATLKIFIPPAQSPFQGPISVKLNSTNSVTTRVHPPDEEHGGPWLIETTDLLWLTIKK